MSINQPTLNDRLATSPVTPVRTLGTLDSDGCRVLRETAATYRDGAEEVVLQLVRDADDLRSDSTELKAAAKGWAQRYHTDPARANVLRCLDLPPDARVLEVGAGCGAISRYLGETCAAVDSLEPVAVRAAAARARTRDLPGVEVLIGELDDVPAEPTYDVVVVVGVLEYVGGGRPDRDPYLDFLAQVAARLVDGGTLVLAIENRLGVKYLAGAPEDHTNRVFDSVEGYPRGGNAHTFNRRELEALMAEVGLAPTTRTAFPDYKMTRAVFGQFPPACRSLLYRIPRFPSPDWRSPRPRLVDERLLWRELVEAGLDADFGNSFLVLATKGAGPSLWPEDLAGAFYTTNRTPALNTATLVEMAGDTVQLRRTALRPNLEEPDSGSEYRIIESVLPFESGTDLGAVLAEGGIDAWRPLAVEWLRLLDEALATHPETAVDVVPHNLIVDDSGDVHVIDVELCCPPVSREQLIRRGVFWLAERCAPLAPVQRWAPARTVGDLMRLLGEPVGLPADGSWIEQAITEELDLLVNILIGTDDTNRESRTHSLESWLRGRITPRLADLPLGERLPERAAAAEKAASSARKAAATAQAKIATLDKELAKTKRRLAAAESSRRRLERTAAIRATRRARRASAQLLPTGTRRRQIYNRLRGR